MRYETTLDNTRKFKLYNISNCHLNFFENVPSVKKGKLLSWYTVSITLLFLDYYPFIGRDCVYYFFKGQFNKIS